MCGTVRQLSDRLELRCGLIVLVVAKVNELRLQDVVIHVVVVERMRRRGRLLTEWHIGVCCESNLTRML